MTTNEFFEAVSNMEINDLDMYNHVQQITDDFKPQKLQMLCDDFDMYVRRKLQLSDIDVNSGQPLYISDHFSDKPNEEQKDDLKKLDDSSDDFSLDEYQDKYSYPTEIKFLQRLRILLVNLTKKHIINRNLSIEDDSNKVKHPIDEYIISNSEKAKNNKRLHRPDEPFKQSSTGINFSVFNKVIYLTDYWHHGDKTVFNKLLNKKTDFVEICEEFESELKINIVLAQSDSSLKRLFRHYLLEMNDLYRSENKIQDLKSYANVPNSHKEKYRSYKFKRTGDDEYTEADKFQNYILAKDAFLSIIFESLRNNIHRTGISITYFEKELKNSFLFLDDELLIEFHIAKEIEGIYKTDETCNQKYIKWLINSDDTLEQFIEALKKHDLIEARNTKAIIKDHFQPIRNQNREPEPIEWLETIALLAYMIESLYQHYIKPENIWSDTAPHFSVNGKTPENLRQTANRFKQNKSRKPKNHEIIDNIIQSLPE